MSNLTDISKIGGKIENPDAKQYIIDQGLADTEEGRKQYITHDEWNSLVNAVSELQTEDAKNIKNIKFNGVYQALKNDDPDHPNSVAFSQTSDSTTYRITVASNISEGSSRTVKYGSDIEFKYRYKALETPSGDEPHAYGSVPGSLTISRIVDGGVATTVYVKSGLNNVNEDDQNPWNETINLKNYLISGNNSITCTFSTTYVDEYMQTKIVSRSYTFYINVINLAVENLYEWWKPIDWLNYGGNAQTGSGRYFPIHANISGATQKWLHIKITGKSQTQDYETVIEYDASMEGDTNEISTAIQLKDSSNVGIFNHGIHNVKLWLTCDDGSGEPIGDTVKTSIISEIVNYRIMMLNPNAGAEALRKTYLILQKPIDSADNFTQTELVQFALWRSTESSISNILEMSKKDASLQYDSLKVKLTNMTSDQQEDGNYYDEIYFDTPYAELTGEHIYSVDSAIEIDADQTVTYIPTYLRFEFIHNEETSNILADSDIIGTNSASGTAGIAYSYIYVSNNADYLPVTNNLLFYLNPKTRSNTETAWNTIINANSGEQVSSIWSNFNHSSDGWVKNDDGIGVLRILAGEKIIINDSTINPLMNLQNSAAAPVTFEIECMIKNVTNTDDPIVKLAADDTNYGITMNPLEGFFTCAEKTGVDTQNFKWAEGRRTHFAFTINPTVHPADKDIREWLSSKYTNKNPSVPLARVYINGKCSRAFTYNITNNDTWGTGQFYLELGQDGADIDIYSIRCYGAALTSNNIKQNIISSRPTIAEKNKIKNENDICDSNGLIQRNAVQEKLKRNTLTLHSSSDTYMGIDSIKNPIRSWLEIRMYDPETGEEDKAHGGRIGYYAYTRWKGKTKTVVQPNIDSIVPYKIHTQGSTAATYWWHNWAGKVNDIVCCVAYKFDKLHADFLDYNYLKNAPNNPDGKWNVSIENAFAKSCWDEEKGETGADAKYPMYLGDPENGGVQIQGDTYPSLSDIEKSNVYLVVQDGWEDWNGMYHGQCWRCSDKSPRMKKLCNKINYASSMGHHKKGACDLYNDIMTGILKDSNNLPLSHDNAHCPEYAFAHPRFCVEEVMFYYFQQNEYNDKGAEMQVPFYHGPCSFGGAKADKDTWGYNESDFPHMCLFEGADNDVPLTDFLVPFCDAIYSYDSNKSDWSYAMINATGEGNVAKTVLAWDFDLGYEKQDLNETTETTDTNPQQACAPCQNIEDAFRMFVDFWYCHNTRFNWTNRSLDNLNDYYKQLIQQGKTTEAERLRSYHVWSNTNYEMYRFDYKKVEFVTAGTWNQSTLSCDYTAHRYLNTYGPTKTAYEAWAAEGSGDFDKLNIAFRQAMAKSLREDIGSVCNVTSLLTAYNVIQQLLCGTDNCSKNIYFTYAPVSYKKDAQGKQIYGNAEGTHTDHDPGTDKDGIPYSEKGYSHPVFNYQWYAFQDDVDTVLPADNTGQMTKVWFTTRAYDMWDYNHGLKSRVDFEGRYNVMFNSLEDAYDDMITADVGKVGTDMHEDANTLQNNMGKVLTKMISLSSSDDYILNYTAESSVMSVWYKYFLQWADYFPIVAYNEAGRIKYEWPQAQGYVPAGAGARAVDPVFQHNGSQLEAEIDFCEKRSVYFASYAFWGELSGGSGLGIADAKENFTTTHLSAQPNAQIIFRDLSVAYPMYCGGSYGNSIIVPHVRVVPGMGSNKVTERGGESYTMPTKYTYYGPTAEYDKGATVYGINYYTDIGNQGDLVVSTGASLTMTGKRLTTLNITPTNNASENKFSPPGLDLSRLTNLETIYVKSAGMSCSLDLSNCVRLRKGDFRNSNISSVTFAKCTTLKELYFDKSLTTLVLDGLINLSTMLFEDDHFYNISKISLKNVPQNIYDTVIAYVGQLIV